jgi:hypothetical protein
MTPQEETQARRMPLFKDPSKLVVSPQVHPDRRVTLRLYAPLASKVHLVAAGINVTLGGPVPMERDAGAGRGAWPPSHL